MLDFLIYIALGIALLFAYVGTNKHNEYGFVVAAALVTIVAIGLFATGWETYSAPTFKFSYSGARTTSIETQPLQILPVLNGTSEQQTIYAIAILLTVTALVLTFLSFQERKRNKAVQGK